jgi:outer membrane protein OmpA-like peptidoglycan-associated protein
MWPDEIRDEPSSASSRKYCTDRFCVPRAQEEAAQGRKQGMVEYFRRALRVAPLVPLCVLFSEVVAAHIQQFHASWEKSSWTVDANPQNCAMVHDIPRFGRARFEQKAGSGLQFSLYVDQPPIRDHAAQIHSEAPEWKHQAESRSLGGFNLQRGKNPLRVPREQSLRIYYELEQGMKPVIEFSDWGDGRDQVRVALMPVRFREALPKFLDCTAQLLYLDFTPVSERTVLFATDSDRLSRSTRRILEGIARDYRKHRNFRIVLGGHTDERGEADYNMDLSRRRSLMVARYLGSRGVPRRAIESRYFGETYPENPQSNQQAWARNRRVTVWLANQ